MFLATLIFYLYIIIGILIYIYDYNKRLKYMVREAIVKNEYDNIQFISYTLTAIIFWPLNLYYNIIKRK